MVIPAYLTNYGQIMYEQGFKEGFELGFKKGFELGIELYKLN